MLVFDEEQILKSVTPAEVLQVVEAAMLVYETEDYLMPPRSHVYQGDNTLLLMPCFNQEGFGTKLVSVFPGNAIKGKPVTNGIMVLNDGETGEPLALFNGQVLTALRTGAVGGVGVKHLAKNQENKLGLIGIGGQGFYQAIFAAHSSNVKKIVIYNRTSAKGEAFIKKLALKLPEYEFSQTESVEELLKQTDIVITSTTSMEPVLPNNPELLRGKHFVGIGSFKPEMREYPQAIYELVEQVFVDTNFAKEETGDLAIPLRENWLQESQVTTLGRWLKNGKEEKTGETTFFKSVGMALFDLMVAQLIYRKGIELGLGQKIEL